MYASIIMKFVLSWSVLLTYMYNIHKHCVQEKALRDATDTGAQDLVEALSQLDEMVGHYIYMRSKMTHVMWTILFTCRADQSGQKW